MAHTDEFREAAVSERGDYALITGAKALALTALRLIYEPNILAEIKAEFQQRKELENFH